MNTSKRDEILNFQYWQQVEKLGSEGVDVLIPSLKIEANRSERIHCPFFQLQSSLLMKNHDPETVCGAALQPQFLNDYGMIFHFLILSCTRMLCIRGFVDFSHQVESFPPPIVRFSCALGFVAVSHLI